MNRRAIAMMFVVRLGRACVVIIRCTLARISVYRSIFQCSGHPDTKAYPPIPSRIFPVPSGREVGYGCANVVRIVLEDRPAMDKSDPGQFRHFVFLIRFSAVF